MAETTVRKCPLYDCYGLINPTAEKGRLVTHHGTRLEIPEDVLIPTCSECGERFYNEETADRVDKRLDQLLDDMLSVLY